MNCKGVSARPSVNRIFWFEVFTTFMMYSCRKSPDLKSLLFCEADRGRQRSKWNKIKSVISEVVDYSPLWLSTRYFCKWVSAQVICTDLFYWKSLKYFNKKLMDFDAKCSIQYQFYNLWLVALTAYLESKDSAGTGTQDLLWIHWMFSNHSNKGTLSLLFSKLRHDKKQQTKSGITWMTTYQYGCSHVYIIC